MNAYYDKNEQVYSNKGIMEAYFGESVKTVGGLERALGAILSALSLILSILTCDVVRRVAKALSVAVCLVGFVGVIGAMERGTLGLGLGILIGMLLLGLEVLCLRPRHRK